MANPTASLASNLLGRANALSESLARTFTAASAQAGLLMAQLSEVRVADRMQSLSVEEGRVLAAIGASIVVYFWHTRSIARRVEEATAERVLTEFEQSVTALRGAVQALHERQVENAKLMVALAASEKHAVTVAAAAEVAARDGALHAAESIREEEAAIVEEDDLGPPLTIWDIGDGARSGWTRRHVRWALHECLTPPASLGYELVCAAEDGAHCVHRAPVEQGVWKYRREFHFPGISAAELCSYLSTTVESLECVIGMSNSIARKATSMASVDVRRVAKVQGNRAVTYWRTRLGPLLKDRDIVMFEQKFTDNLPAGAHALLLCCSGSHAEIPNPCNGAIRVEHYTAQLVLADGPSDSRLSGCYLVDLRDIPSMFAKSAGRQLGIGANEVMHQWVVDHHRKLKNGGAAH